MASFVEGKDIQLFEGFLYEKSNRQYAGTDYDFINIANQATESVRDKTTDELISAFNENFGLGEKPTEKETEIKNKVANQIKAKEEISLPDAKVFNNWTRKTYGYPKSIENVSKGIAQYNAVNQKYKKRLFSRWFEWTGLFPEATKEKKALEKMKNHMEGVLNVPVEKISKSLADGKQLSDLVADLSRKEDHPIFMNKKMNELFPQKESDLDSKAIDIPNELFENKDININLNNDPQLEQVKENEKVIE